MDIVIPDNVSTFAGALWAWLVDFLPRLGAAVLILVAGFFIARYAARGVGNFANRSQRVDATIRPVLAAVVRYGIVILVLIAALGQLGVQTASILAALGAAGLAIGLALQGTLANVAAGVMLLWLRPFRVGEYIDNGDVAGTVKEIGLFATRLDTFDGNYRFVPNGLLWAKPLVNYSRNANRMTNVIINVSYEADIGRARQLLLDLITADKRVLTTPAPEVTLENLGENSVTLAMKAWIPNGVYWPTQRQLVQDAKALLKANGIAIAFPQRIVHVVRDDDGAGRGRDDFRPGRDTHVPAGPAEDPPPPAAH